MVNPTDIQRNTIMKLAEIDREDLTDFIIALFETMERYEWPEDASDRDKIFSLLGCIDFWFKKNIH